MNRPSALSPRAFLRLMAAVFAALLLMPVGIGCAGRVAASTAPEMATHMDCQGKRPPVAPAHDCRSDCALACAALPVPPSPGARTLVAIAEPSQRTLVSVAYLVNGPAPPPPRG